MVAAFEDGGVGMTNRRRRWGQIQASTKCRIRASVLSNARYKCQLCGRQKRLCIHHIAPISMGGPIRDTSNMVALCRNCHEKTHRLMSCGVPVAYFQWLWDKRGSV